MNVATLISDKLKDAINKFGTASLVVPGGSSPIKIFKDLSQIELAWSKVQILSLIHISEPTRRP